MSPSSNPSKTASPGAGDPNPPTYAAFSPITLGHLPATTKQRSTILVHQKSPLLAATPPQVTRALAYSHPFLLPLNKFVGLLSWTTGDPWESFLFIAAFWAITLYGDTVMRFAGPIVAVAGIILGMYTRRYSPLSSTGWTGEKAKGHKRGSSVASESHQKSLEDIVDTLKLFTSRCNILLDPFIRLTDFLSTQRTATSATTRPALTTLFIRILFLTPFWLVFTLPPLRLLTTRRIVLAFGTWRDGRRGQDGWGRYTRRRKWCRDAELVEITPSTEITPSPTPKPPLGDEPSFSEADTARPEETPSEYSMSTKDDTGSDGKVRKRRWFGRRPSRAASVKSNATGSVDDGADLDPRSDEEDVHTPLRYHATRESEWGLGDEARMDLG
ncbi:hypothetical protein SLS57_010706 [Botryosphaeria dothidea]